MPKLIPILLIIFGASLRLFPHPDNFAPITALALFGGVYLPKKYAFIIPLVALVISDLVLGFYGFTQFFVYGSSLISGLIGLMSRKRKNLPTILIATILASVLFYLITNFAVWLEPRSWYSKDLAGLIQSYIAGIPFFRNTLLGDIFYTGLFFGIYQLGFYLGKKYLPKKIFSQTFQ